MRISTALHLSVLAIGLVMPTMAFTLEAGTRDVPAKEIAVPTTDVSPQEQALIGTPLRPFWNDHPKDAVAWKAMIKTRADQIIKTLPDLRVKFEIKSEQITIAGVNCYILTPSNIPDSNRNRLLVHVQSHAQYAGDPNAPETKEHFGELTSFFASGEVESGRFGVQ